MISQTRSSVVPLKELAPKTLGPDPFKFQLLRDVKSVKVKWLWEPYIPKGALTLIMGDGGYGKSWMTCALAADLSAGRALPGQDPLPPQRVLMVSAEDGLSQVVKPKMEMLQANMDNIQASDQGFTLNGDAMVHLVRYIKDYDVAIAFFDPLVVYMGGKIDSYKANEVRGMMNMLAAVARDTETAIVAVHHVRKSSEGSALQHKVLGSADFINGVRSGLLVDVSKGGQRYMAHVKSNWAANGATLAYSFGQNGFAWDGLYDGSLHDDTPQVSLRPRGQVAAWLKVQLRDGPVSAVEMLQRAGQENFSETTVQRAKKGIVKSYITKGVWYWELEDGTMEQIQREEAYALPAAQGRGDELKPGELINAMANHSLPMNDASDPLAYARAVLAAKGQVDG